MCKHEEVLISSSCPCLLLCPTKRDTVNLSSSLRCLFLFFYFYLFLLFSFVFLVFRSFLFVISSFCSHFSRSSLFSSRFSLFLLGLSSSFYSCFFLFLSRTILLFHTLEFGVHLVQWDVDDDKLDKNHSYLYVNSGQ